MNPMIAYMLFFMFSWIDVEFYFIFYGVFSSFTSNVFCVSDVLSEQPLKASLIAAQCT